MTPTTRSRSYRLPVKTLEQIQALCDSLGTTATQTLIMAIDRMAREELKKKEKPKAKNQSGPTGNQGPAGPCR